MYVLFCSIFRKVRNHGFVSAYMLGRMIIQNALSLIALDNGRTFANLSELLRALLSARYRLHSRKLSSSLLIPLNYGSLLIFPNNSLVLAARHIQ